MCVASGSRSAQREQRDFAEQAVAHRIGRVRRDSDSHERSFAAAHPGDFSPEFARGFFALHGIRSERLAVRNAAHAEFEHCRKGRVVRRRIRERRDSREQSLASPGEGALEQLFPGQFRARRHEGPNPIEERESTERSTQRREIEMRVRIHEARREDHIAEFNIASGGRTGARANVGDDFAVDRDGSVLDRWSCNGKDRARVVAHGSMASP